MKLLKHIEDSQFIENKNIENRFASRAIIFDENGLVPILLVSKYGYHKLPGGGIEDGEDKIKALHREIEEETGCKAEISGEIGEITEHRSKWDLFQTSYCYLGKVLSKGKLNFTKKEKNQGFELKWMTIDEAISSLRNDKPQNYEGVFIQQRDLAFLEEARRLTSEAS